MLDEPILLSLSLGDSYRGVSPLVLTHSTPQQLWGGYFTFMRFIHFQLLPH